ncbi:hypothetical protein SCHPADRAFT_868569 [Schizopora paradoxa]|uniref:Nephrocystin 3-like N-terminal domain-containing protein n=1 Tax=Schizopora paradoxa TaxID=27342 RepID=A0A0H2SJ33_9AGAM|nr:hypothetical protein SCHPADRAFT_868569 [Schizopora paradoxa]
MDDLLRSLVCAEGASFNSYRTRKITPCSPETRVDILNTIQEWVTHNSGHLGRIFWLNGLAGIGKSSISMTIASWAESQGYLGASFFFARDLCDVLTEDKSIGSKELSLQFEGLIRRPLSACNRHRPILIVLDALDECSPERDVEEALRIIMQLDAKGEEMDNLRIFIASRPEAHIRSLLEPSAEEGHHTRVVLHDISSAVVRNDIARYLETEFSRITHEFKLREGWVSEEDFASLLDDSGNFFEYAATTARFIGDTRIRDPRKQLQKVLRIKTGHGKSTRIYANLDRLYLGVLMASVSENSDDEDLEELRNVIGTLVLLRNPLPLDQLAVFLSMEVDRVRSVLYHLHSVIIVSPEDSIPPRFFHPSFYDFITDNQRCDDERFLIRPKVHENTMCSRCLKLIYYGLRDVKVRYGGLRGRISFASREEALLSNRDGKISQGANCDVSTSIAKELWRNYGNAVVYACEHLPSHLVPSHLTVTDTLANEINHFLDDWVTFRNWYFITALGIDVAAVQILMVRLYVFQRVDSKIIFYFR